MDTFSRRIVGWSIDSSQDSALVVKALDMAIRNRRPVPGGIVHADHGVQFTSGAFTNKIRSAGLMPSFGTIGDGYDNAMMESFWSSMQIELVSPSGVLWRGAPGLPCSLHLCQLQLLKAQVLQRPLDAKPAKWLNFRPSLTG